MASLEAFAASWLANPWLLWGVGPLVASQIGFFLTATFLELVLATGWLDSVLICYASSKNTPRKQLVAQTQQRIPFWKQVRGCMFMLLGPTNLVNGVVFAMLMRLIQPNMPTSWLPTSATAFAWQFLLLMLLADFGLYWGHRVQHEVGFLWKLHAKHHAIDTPTPYSTLFIDPVDASLQGSIPIAAAALALRPAPAVLYFFIAFRIAENAINHSGVDHWLFDLLTLKLLPLRAPASFHDAHHKYSCHLNNAKNYGESFWIWDAMFNTSSPLTGRAISSVNQKEQ